jgi:hypothetical protein
MKTYTLSELEAELKAIDPRLEVRVNANRPGLANVMLDGKDVIPCPAEEIREDVDPTYYYVFPNGMQGRHKSRQEILDRVHYILDYIKTEEGKEIFFA